MSIEAGLNSSENKLKIKTHKLPHYYGLLVAEQQMETLTTPLFPLPMKQINKEIRTTKPKSQGNISRFHGVVRFHLLEDLRWNFLLLENEAKGNL